MTDPISFTPAPRSGMAPDFYGPTFDAAAVAIEIGTRPSTRPIGHLQGTDRDPAEPWGVPEGVDVPADLVAAYADYDRKRDAHASAIDARDDYQADAQQSRALRSAAILAAGRAAARGAKRPEIPEAVTEDAEAVEVKVLSVVIDTRRAEADAAARRCDALVATHAAEWVPTLAGRFGPALASAEAAVQTARDLAVQAESTLSQVALYRAHAIAEALRRRGVRVTDHQVSRIASDVIDATKTQLYASAEAQHRSPSLLLTQVQTALGELRACDPEAVPGADTLDLPGGFAEARDVWHELFTNAPEASRQRYRLKHTGGRLLSFERRD